MNNFVISDYLQDREGYRGVCKACLKYVGWSKEKTASHKRLCPGSDEEMKRFFAKRLIDVKANVSFADDFNNDYCSNCKLTEEKINEINSKLASLILCSGISLHVVKSQEFKEFVTSLNSTYANTMPCEKKLLSETFVDQQDVKLFTLLESSDDLTLVSDGWNNIRGDHIVNFCVKAPNQKPFFYDSINTTEVIQNSQTVANEICMVLEKLGPEKFTNIITDNAPGMKDAWKLVETKYPHISANGCVAHGMNLLIKGILDTDENSDTCENSENIIKFVTNHHIVKTKYEEKRIAENIPETLTSSEPARWLSRYTSMNNLLASKNILIKLVDEQSEALKQIAPKQTSESVLNIIKSTSFWTKLRSLVELIEYPANIIGKELNILPSKFKFKFHPGKLDDDDRSSVHLYFAENFLC